MISYYCFIVTLSPSGTVSEILPLLQRTWLAVASLRSPLAPTRMMQSPYRHRIWSAPLPLRYGEYFTTSRRSTRSPGMPRRSITDRWGWQDVDARRFLPAISLAVHRRNCRTSSRWGGGDDRADRTEHRHHYPVFMGIGTAASRQGRSPPYLPTMGAKVFVHPRQYFLFYTGRVKR